MPPKKAADGTTAPKPKPTHGTYQDMITDAIIILKDRNGSSRIKLKKYVKANNNISVASDAVFDAQFNKALRAGVEKGIFEQPKGPSGGTKLAKKAKVAPKKDAPKKKAPAKKEGEKKKAPPKKKAAAPKEKKAAAPKKETSTTEKKAAPKKAAAAPKEKKAAAPKKEVKEKKDPLKKTAGGRVSKPKAAAPKKAAPKKAAPKKAASKKESAAA